MGADGLTEATKYAILNANYISKRLENYFPTLYRSHGLVAHECILDLRAFHATTAEDVAKRLMDYGFHAPTLSFPVAGTLMVEPTESESKYELDRFCDAMISIHAEMTAVENGTADAKNNLLKNAPHTTDQIASDNWNRPYSREQAAFPAKSLHDYKFWPHVSRVDNVFGDRTRSALARGWRIFRNGKWPESPWQISPRQDKRTMLHSATMIPIVAQKKTSWPTSAGGSRSSGSICSVSAADGNFKSGTGDLDFLVRFADREPTGEYADRYLNLAEAIDALLSSCGPGDRAIRPQSLFSAYGGRFPPAHL